MKENKEKTKALNLTIEKLSSKKNPNYIKAINIINKYFTN